MYRKTFFFVMVLTLTIGLSLLAGLVAVLAAPPLQEEGQVYIVVTDDWLSKLADKYLGNPMAYSAIVKFTNQKHAEDDSYAEIENPDLIEIGWKIYIPSAEEAATILQVSTEDKKCEQGKKNDEIMVVTCTFGEEEKTPVSFRPIEVKDRQPLELKVVGDKKGTHFTLEIDKEAYPKGQENFTFAVTVTSKKEIADNPGQYPEVCGVTGGYPKIWVGAECVLASNPYAVSVTGFDEFSETVTTSISIEPPGGACDPSQEHEIMIYEEGPNSEDTGAKRYAAELVPGTAEGDLPRLQNREPIFHCCREHGH